MSNQKKNDNGSQNTNSVETKVADTKKGGKNATGSTFVVTASGSTLEYAAPVKRDKKFTWKEVKRQKSLIFISALVFIYGCIFYYWPLTGWGMAFVDYKPTAGILGSKWIGLEKFEFLFTNPLNKFWPTMRNTFCMGLLNLVTTTVMAVLFAILLNEIKSNIIKKPIQTISYLPHFLSWIIVTGILHDSLSSTGIVNDLLMKMGAIDSPINAFAEPNYFWGIVAFANCWKETGWNAIIYLAAITSIDPCLYEAASIDGAGRLQKIRYITLPGIRPTFMILLLINVGNVLNAGFEVQYLLGNGLVKSVSQTIDIFVLDWGISQNDFSLGSAAGIFKSVISIVLIFIANTIAKKTGDERLF
ncbi:MAG: ABC transporter permease subunit [Lachnospiraceae bacterium]|nr:ABC transporter permease subunit [Lachnospiraceae bacterium]